MAMNAAERASSLEFLPPCLFEKNMTQREAGVWAQIAKQFISFKVGVYVTRGDECSDAQQAVKAMFEYEKWVRVIEQHYLDNKITQYMLHTTATMKKPVNGTAIMRQFKAGMGVFGNSLNPLWQKVLRDRTSGKSPDDLWLAFLRAYEAERNTKRKRLVSFVVEKVEKSSWILVYKHLGPPASTLYGREVLEEIVTPNRFQYRGTGRDARREGKLSRAVHREEQQAVREHHTRTARTSHHHDMMYKIGVEQTVQQAMNGIVSQMSMKRQMLALALEHVDNGADKARLV